MLAGFAQTCGHFHALGAFKALRQMQNLNPVWNALLLHFLHEMQKVSSVDDPVIQDAGMVTNSHKGTEPVHTKCGNGQSGCELKQRSRSTPSISELIGEI